MRLTSILFSAMALTSGSASAQEEVETLFRTALANSPTPIRLRAQQEAWKADPTASAPDVAELTETIRRDATVRQARISLRNLGGVCVDTGLADCKTFLAGSMITRDGEAIYYQIQGSFPSMAEVFLVADGSELKPIAWTFGGLEFPIPQIHQIEDGPTYVGVSGYELAAGANNTNVIFRWDAASRSLVEIDAYSWEDGLAARLPGGLLLSHGVKLNWSTLWGTATLFREEDPGCCGTAGLASLGFKIEDDRLILTEVDVHPDE